jgi:hypothetical protein
MHRPDRTTIAGLVLVLSTGTGFAAVGNDPVRAMEEIRAARLDPQAAVAVHDLEIDLGEATFRVDRGALIPTTPVGGTPAELVFQGEARFVLDPPDPLEAEQLRLFTGTDLLDVSVHAAVLVLPQDDVVGILLEREPAHDLDAGALTAAEDLYRKWRNGAPRRRFGVDSALLRDTVGDAGGSRFFAAWCVSERVGEFHYLFDPDEYEQVAVGQFVPLSLGDADQNRVERLIRRGKREGRYSQLRLQDLGDWDTWFATTRRSSSGAVVPGRRGFEPERYTLEVDLARKSLWMTATARIDLTATRSGRRAVRLRLFPDLVVNTVSDENGNPLFFHQSGSDVTVCLERVTETGDRVTVVVGYEGGVIEKVGYGAFALRSTLYWYPHAGTENRATYDVTFRWPRKWTLLAGGCFVDGGLKDGRRWERRTLDVPTNKFSFELGRYDLYRETVGDVEIRVALARTTRKVERPVVEEVRTTVREALRFYNLAFGQYPVDELTFVTTHRHFSQGSLSFVTLAHPLLTGVGLPYWGTQLRRIRTETIAHEIAHQWWGNKVGWKSYRDQWLSEALAEYSEVLFAYYRLGRRDSYRLENVQSRRLALAQKAENGRSVESIGPVVMGSRLDSSLSNDAYRAVVYDKGFLVFNMLAAEIGEEEFIGMLGALADAAAYENIDTQTFLRAVEHMSGRDLDAFAERFVFGTGIPNVFVRYDLDALDDGRWRVSGEARQYEVVYTGTDVVRTEAGAWDAVARFANHLRPDTAFLDVPYEVELAGDGNWVDGKIRLEGETTPFEIVLDARPVQFRLDPRGHLLAHVYDETASPKAMLRARGLLLTGLGRFDEAEELFRSGLAADVEGGLSAPDGEGAERIRKADRNRMDSILYFDLARHYLDRGETANAEDALQTADRLLRGAERGWFRFYGSMIESRLDLHRFDYEGAYDRLRRHLRLEFQQRAGESMADQLRRVRFRRGFTGDGQAYALLAIAARETGRDAVYLRAAEEAVRRGGNLGEFDAPPSSP